MKDQKKFRKHVISCMVSVIMFCSCLLAVSMSGNAAEKGKSVIKVACVGGQPYRRIYFLWGD